MEEIRVQKFLSEAGVASRRKAEEFIKSKQVIINGRVAVLGDKVNPAIDEVKVYGKIIKPAESKLYIALNKPKGYVVSKRDPQGRKTVFSLLPPEYQGKVWNVGRLDFETEGLLILTNDGDLTQKLAHPSFEHDKEYEVTVTETPTTQQIEQLREGVEIATGMTSPATIKARGNKVFTTIHEGKKRQVRRMFDAVGLSVINLKRIRVNKYKLEDLPVGQYKKIKLEDLI